MESANAVLDMQVKTFWVEVTEEPSSLIQITQKYACIQRLTSAVNLSEIRTPRIVPKLVALQLLRRRTWRGELHDVGMQFALKFA